jgi:Lon protease-like protein
MFGSTEGNDLPLNFDGKVRLFPLPNYVFFPGVVKGLHIFEPRYCAMLKDSLASDKLIAMAVLRPGWESNYHQSPSIYATVGIGRIVHHEPTDDERHNILLRGLCRARVETQSLAEGGYRNACVRTVDHPDPPEDISAELRRSIFEKLRLHDRLLSAGLKIHLSKLEHSSLGDMVDLLAHEFPLLHEEKIRLLEELCPVIRCQAILRWLDTFNVINDVRQPGHADQPNLPDDPFPKVSLN